MSISRISNTKKFFNESILDNTRLQKKLIDRLNRTFEKGFAEYDNQWIVDGLEERLATIIEDLDETNEYDAHDGQQSNQVDENHNANVLNSETVVTAQSNQPHSRPTPWNRAITSYNAVASSSTVSKNTSGTSTAASAIPRTSYSQKTETDQTTILLEDDWMTKNSKKAHQKKK